MSAGERKDYSRGMLSHQCTDAKEAIASAIVAIAQRLSNQIESFAKVADARCEAPVEKTWIYVRIRYLFSSHQSELASAKDLEESKSSGDKRIFHPKRRKVRVRIPKCNSPAIILLKRQRSTGLGRAGAIDCLRRCIVISGRRPGLGAMIGWVVDDIFVVG